MGRMDFGAAERDTICCGVTGDSFLHEVKGVRSETLGEEAYSTHVVFMVEPNHVGWIVKSDLENRLYCRCSGCLPLRLSTDVL